MHKMSVGQLDFRKQKLHQPLVLCFRTQEPRRDCQRLGGDSLSTEGGSGCNGLRHF